MLCNKTLLAKIVKKGQAIDLGLSLGSQNSFDQ